MDIITLFKKYMSGKMKTDDFNLLRQRSSEITDEELSGTLESIWEGAERKPMDEGIKREVQESLHNRLFMHPKPKTNWMKIAVSVLLPVLFLSTVYLLLKKDPMESPQYFTVFSEKGQKSRVYLPDGTIVWLNSDSRITYSSDFNQDNRHVKLDGEAYFDVQYHNGVKFTVETDVVNIVVQGTTFNVNAYQNDSTITASLNEGKITIENSGDNSLMASLRPDEQIMIRKTEMNYSVTTCDAGLNSLWTQNELKIEDASTAEMYRKIEHWYGVNIRLENANPDTRYGFTIKTESLREMLDLINKLTPITYTIRGKEVIITYKS